MSRNFNHLRFGRFRLSTREKCLFQGDEIVPLTKKEFQALLVLVTAEGRVVQKEEILEHLWPDEIVDESNLAHHFGSLRRKLGAQADGASYIETVAGRGYRFNAPVVESEATASEPTVPVDVPEPVVVDAAISSEATATRAGEPAQRRRWIRKALLGASCLILAAMAAALFKPQQNVNGKELDSIAVVDGPTVALAPKVLQFIKVGAWPINTVLSKDQRDLYVTEYENGSVALIDVAARRISKRITVGPKPRAEALSVDGKWLYVASDGGDFTAIDTQTQTPITILKFGAPVIDIALSPDGKYAYLALGFHGLGKVELANRSFKIAAPEVYVQAIAFAQDGRTLLISYQAGGPGGSSGHDAIGYFDTSTDRLVSVSKGFPNVGGDVSVLPYGFRAWEIGADACDSPQYDHAGCPVVPGGLINIIDLQKRTLVRSIGVRGARLIGCSFSPNGEVAAITSSERLILMSVKSMSSIGSLRLASPSKMAFSADGSLGYLALPGESAIAVVQLVVPIRAILLNNPGAPNDTFQVAIVNDAEKETAGQIDPSTLLLGGKAGERSSTGNIDASLGGITGFDGNSLVVRFSNKARKMGGPLVIEGKTYSGIPVRGDLDLDTSSRNAR